MEGGFLNAQAQRAEATQYSRPCQHSRLASVMVAGVRGICVLVLTNFGGSERDMCVSAY
jgi:hypothetical protein